MATFLAWNSMNDTTANITTKTAAESASSSDPASTSFCVPQTQTLYLFGESSSTTADSKASTAPCSETKAATYRPSLSDRLTPLLISAGLVKGITHTSIRKESGAAIRASALWPLDGGDAEEPKEGCLSSNETPKPVEPRGLHCRALRCPLCHQPPGECHPACTETWSSTKSP
jgi:hypothetical protein